MRALRQKLNSQRGASILIALVFFLLCLTVGAVVLTAATANAGRLANRRQEEQNYLSVSSAARLLRDGLAGASAQVKTTVVTNLEDGALIEESTETSIDSNVLDDVLKRFIGGDRSATFLITAEGMASVSASMQMEMDYTLSVKLRLAEGNQESSSMTVTVYPKYVDKTGGAVTSEDEEQGTATTVRTELDVAWGDGVITKGAGT